MKDTQGKKKMLRLLNDYSRDYELAIFLKRAEKEKRQLICYGPADKEGEILMKEFQNLKRKINKYHKKIGFKYRFATAETYRLDGWMIDSLLARRKGDERLERILASTRDEPDMCMVENLYDDELGGEAWDGVISLRPYLLMRRMAFPVAVSIHPGASKNDVLDFIEKNWKIIENNLRSGGPFDKPLRMRKRKHPQEIIDFLWANKEFSDQEIKRRLDSKFPENGLVYHEINKLIHLESERRNYRI